MKLYVWRKFHDHYVVMEWKDGKEGKVVCHCDTPKECREEINSLRMI